MTEDDTCPLTLLTGFLGAGKTTLLSRLLADPQGVRFGVLVNDFGAMSIDAELVAETGVERVALANGCVCCSIRDDLLDAVRTLLDAPEPPDRLVVEASGVSRPLAILEALATEPRLRVDGVFCLIDAARFETLDFADTELAMDQAFGSDVALLNKADLVDEPTLVRIDVTLREAMPRLRTVPARQGDVPRALLFGPATVRGVGPAHRHDEDHDHVAEFETWSWTAAAPVTEDGLRTALASLPEGLLRAKGVFDVGGRRAVFQLVGKRRETRLDDRPAADGSRFVAIARRGRLDEAGLAAVFATLRPGA